jgi:predicted transcriptional regulator of viral defense system
VRRGLYIPVPLESVAAVAVPEDPWSVAEAAFSPCYIGGWSAAEHWGLTEQLFRTVVVFTLSAPRQRRPTIAGTEFWTLGTRDDRMFGLRPVWRDRSKVLVSDPSRTIVDIVAAPAVGGGLRHARDVLQAYLSTVADDDTLIDYAKRYGNGAVFKRLGFLTEALSPERGALIEGCRRNLTAGLAKLDPAIDCDRIVKRWRLRVPARWAKP